LVLWWQEAVEKFRNGFGDCSGRDTRGLLESTAPEQVEEPLGHGERDEWDWEVRIEQRREKLVRDEAERVAGVLVAPGHDGEVRTGLNRRGRLSHRLHGDIGQQVFFLGKLRLGTA
jgi:hypothetical protein